MDLTAQAKIKTSWSYDEGLDIMTVTFKDDTEAITLGDIILEGQKLRSMLSAMEEISNKFFPNLVPQAGHRTVFDNIANKAITEFIP